MALIDEVTAKVQEKLPDVPPETVAELVDRAKEDFCARTLRRAVPVRAKWLWIDLALQMQTQTASGGQSAPVSSIKRGDTQISYAVAAQSELDLLYKKIDGYKVVRAK